MEHKIEKVINDKEMLYERIHKIIGVELQRQKENGKKFITDEEVDALIYKVMNEEIKTANK